MTKAEVNQKITEIDLAEAVSLDPLMPIVEEWIGCDNGGFGIRRNIHARTKGEEWRCKLAGIHAWYADVSGTVFYGATPAEALAAALKKAARNEQELKEPF